MRFRPFAHAMLVACALCLPSVAFAQERPVAEAYILDLAKTVKDVARHATPRTVAIEIHIGGRMGYGSGAIISADGLILSCAHVIEPGSKLVAITPDGTRYDCTKVGINSKNDYGVLKIEPKAALPYFALGSSKALEEGEWVVAFGHPGGPYDDLQPAVAVGRVRGKGKKLPIGFGEKFYKDAILHDCPIFGGNSGGPLVDLDGKLVGINGAILLVNENAYASSIDEIQADLAAMKGGAEVDGEGNFLEIFQALQAMQHEIKPEDMQKLYAKSPLLKFVQQILGENANAPPPKVVVSLGAKLHPDDDGALVFRAVEPLGTAGVAGIRRGDVLVSIDEFPCRNPQQLNSAMLGFVEGQSVDVVVKRDGELKTMSALFMVKGHERQPMLRYAFNRLGRLVASSTVMVREGAENGYGVVLDEGHVLTCDHILGEHAREVRVRLASGVDLPGKVIGRNGQVDLAVLKVDLRGQRFEPVRFGKSGDLTPGDWVVCGGSARGPVTVGAVSAVGRSVVKERRCPAMGLFGMMGTPNESPLRPYTAVFQHDAPLEKGLFGTGAFNADGELVGLNVALWYRGSSYAVPADVILAKIEGLKGGELVEQPPVWGGSVQEDPIQKLMREFFGGGGEEPEAPEAPVEHPRKGDGFIGVSIDSAKGEGMGVHVTAVVDGNPAQKAGVRPGDLIVKVGDVRVRSAEELIDEVSALPPGTRTTVTVIRGDGVDKRSIPLDIEIGRRPPK